MKRDLDPAQTPTLPAGTVRALAPARDAGRFDLRMDQGSLTVSAELIGEFRLAPGRLLDGPEAERLTAGAHRLRVFDRAVNLLAMRGRSTRALRVALRRRGAPPEDVDAAVERLHALGALDDAAYARTVAESRKGSTGMTRRRAVQVLAAKGVDSRTATDVAREVFGEVDETEAGVAQAERRLRSLTKLDPAVRRRRLHAWLARRGYTGTSIRIILQRVLNSRTEDDDQGRP